MLLQWLRPLREGKAVAVCVLLAALVIGAYSSSLRNGFVNLDDPRYVSANRHVQNGLTRDGLRWAFTTFEAGLWHPLTWLSLMLDAQIYGMRASGYHVTSLLLHAANTLLLFGLMRCLTAATWRSAFVAALFGLHPLHVESVAWVAERKDVLSTLFWMLALWAYAGYAGKSADLGTAISRPHRIKTGPGILYVLSLVFFSLSLMSKPMVVTLPLVLLLLDFWPLRRFELRNQPLKLSAWVSNIKHLLLEKAPFFALALLLSIVAVVAQKDAGALQSAARYPVSSRVANALLSYAEYVVQMFRPGHYAVFYSYPKTPSLVAVLLAALLLLALSLVSVFTARQRPYLAFGWTWYIVTLLPVIGIIQVGNQARADRYTYVPLIGLFAILAWGAYDLTCSWRRQRLVLLVGAGMVTVISLLLTIHQIDYWQNSEALYEHAIAVTDHNELAEQNLAADLSSKGRIDEAIVHWQKAVELAPDYALAQGNLGAGLLRKGRLDESIVHSQAAIRLMPNFAGAHRNLGAALGASGRLDQAVTELREALRLAPDDAQSHYYLGSALAGKGRLDEAIAEYAEAVRLAPSNPGVRNAWRAALAARAAGPQSMR